MTLVDPFLPIALSSPICRFRFTALLGILAPWTVLDDGDSYAKESTRRIMIVLSFLWSLLLYKPRAEDLIIIRYISVNKIVKWSYMISPFRKSTW